MMTVEPTALPMATLSAAGVLGLMLVVLSVRVIVLRYRRKVGIGDGAHADLTRAIRVHGNFVEYVPFALILLFFVEQLGYASWIPWSMALLLILGRFAHAFGLTHSTGSSIPRIVGVVSTFTVILSGSALCLAAMMRD